jgi:hypothetical protein
MRRWLVGMLLAPLARAVFTEHLLVQSDQMCTVRSRIYAPAESEPVYVDRLAWPVGGPALPEPLTLNGRGPTSPTPELICMMGCPSPPCQPVSACPMGALHWSVRYAGLIVQPGSPLVLPDAQTGTTGVPPMLLMLYNTAATVPTPSPQAGPTPGAGITIPTSSAAPGIIERVTVQPCSDAATPVAITFSILFGLVTLGLVGVCQIRRRLPCPYCSAQLVGGAAAVREHLKTCGVHLAEFQPTVLEPVLRVVDRQTVQLSIGEVAEEEKEDLIARPVPL